VADRRAVQARHLAEQAAESGEKFSAKSPTGAEVVAIASIALSLSLIAEVHVGVETLILVGSDGLHARSTGYSSEASS